MSIPSRAGTTARVEQGDTVRSCSMEDTKITCPECRAEFALTDTLAGPMLAEMRSQMEAERVAALAAQKAEIEANAPCEAQAE